MSSPTEAPLVEPDAASPSSDPLFSTSPAPTEATTPQEFSPPAPPPPPSRNSSSPASTRSSPPPPSSAFAPSPDSLPSRAPPPPSKSTRPSPPPSPSNSSRTTSPSSPAAPPPSPPPPASRTTHSSPPPPFLSSPPPPATKSSPSTTSATSPPAPPPSSSTISGASLVGIGVAGVLAFSVLSVLFYCLCRKKKRYSYPGEYYNANGGPPKHYKDPYYGVDMRHQQEWPSSDALIKMPPHTAPLSPRNGYDPIPPPPTGGSPGLGNTKSWFTYQDLATATGGFSKTNELGEGGFGCVYKGTLSSGQLVAVKQLKAGASQGEKEFQAEVEIISRVHHRHLVSLVGYCIADRQRLLVYDYVPNGTLEHHLHKKRDGPVMDWPTRLKIACGAARGLAYLHEDCHPRIIHRDIKSSNILLDDNFEAQVSDFGLAKLTSDTNTHVTTRVMGTFGYLAPEYASSGKLTDRSDVFSFGVVLLELLTGRKPVDPLQPPGEESLVEWARPVLAQVSSEEDLMEVVDPALEGVFDSREAMRMLEAAAACVRHSANKRPRMGQVVRALEDDSSLSDLDKGLKPGQSGVFGSPFASGDYENGSYSADMRKYMRVALDTTQEFGSECSGATSDYGMNASMSSGEFRSREMVDQTSRQQQGREAVDRSSTQQQPRREVVDRTSSQQQPHREMVDQTSSQQQRPRAMSVRANMLNFNTQEFRLGS